MEDFRIVVYVVLQFEEYRIESYRVLNDKMMRNHFTNRSLFVKWAKFPIFSTSTIHSSLTNKMSFIPA